MLSKDDIQDIYGLAPMQEAMLIAHARDPASTAYVEQFDFTLDGALDAAALQASADALVARHDVLRSVFSHRRTDRPRQIVLRRRRALLETVDFASLPAAEASAAADAWAAADRARGFDLNTGPVLRFALLRLAPARHRVVMTFHHIALDGWCLGLLFDALFSGYAVACAGGAPDASREASPYREYIRWVEGRDRAAAGAFWADRLAGYDQPQGVPFADLPRRGAAGHAVHAFNLGHGLSAALAAQAAAQRLTVNSLFQTAWGVLLQKYNRTDDVVFGNVVSGRPAALTGVERMVGLFINTVPLRARCAADEPFAAVAARVQRDAVDAMPHEFLPLFEIQSHSPLRNRLLDHIVAFENYPVADRVRQLAGAGAALQVADVQVHERTNYAFNLIVNPGDDIRIQFNHDPGQFDAAVLHGLERSLRCLLEQVARDATMPVGALRLCADADARTIVGDWNATAAPYPRDEPLGALFDAAAARHAGAVALRHRGRGTSYTALQRLARRLARQLAERGVERGDRVALRLPRCPEQVVAMLAVVSLGAAYVPLDAAATPERTAFVLDDAAVVLTCTLPALATTLPAGAPLCIVDLHELKHDADVDADGLPAAAPVDPESAAYVMYTSGSTGQPKGCAVSHRNVARLVCGNDFVPFGADLRILQTGSPAFDASTFEIWGALLNGGRLCLVDEVDILDARRLARHLADEGITTLWLTSALFDQLCDADVALFAPLEHLLVGGDALSPRHIARVRAAHPRLAVINGYGPTENTTFSTTFRIDGDNEAGAGRVPIGRPIRNATAYVVDAAMQLLPPGAFGELCVGGDGVALGYVNRPELTAERFVADPFAPGGGRLYRTGDVVRWLPDGTLDMRGRDDQQVKIRGFRVELGEVERALAALPGVDAAAVVVHDGAAGRQLHAHYAGPAALAPPWLRAQLAARLASYLVPAAFQHLPRLPLTANGKLDRRALPAIDLDAQRGHNDAIAAPRSTLEARIADVVKAVLGIERIDIHDNFFEIGATSLTLIAINNRLKEALERECAVTALFEHPSVARLAAHLSEGAGAEAARQADESERLAQARATLLRTKRLMNTLEEQTS